MLPLDKLPAKDFHHKNTAPDLPIDWTTKEPSTPVTPGEAHGSLGSNKEIVNPRELFAKFMNDVENNKI